ncbi:SDR family oxidoreductase [Ramlibacter henchirensis]|uniref:SDR family oxidoreductase n=2 Tax=Ramlibacter henchirensis TaxID=204072 RepID=A0A4Z0BV25_9BURK|nr:SDR family oxidoreductase [Ramlibacter henchirensis]
MQAKVVAVTGAFGQLGRAVVEEVRAQGARVALLDVSGGQAPEGSRAWRVDLTSLADATRTFDEIAEHFGRLDALANVAGGFRWQTLEASSDLSEWDLLHAMNVRTCVTASKAALPHLLRSGAGRIVSVGAMGAVKGASGMGAYAASKAGVMRFTEALADELKLKGVTVNAVLPSIIDTPANRAEMPQAKHDRWVPPRDIARVIAFLLSDAAASVTGALIPVTGKT